MGELAPDPTGALAQDRAAAQAFAAGRDGIALIPPGLRAPVVLWQQRLQSAGEALDHEGWLLGLLTLTCLLPRDSSSNSLSVPPSGGS